MSGPNWTYCQTCGETWAEEEDPACKCRRTTTSCPLCGDEDYRVHDTRRIHDAGYIMRERDCQACQARWETREYFHQMIAHGNVRPVG